MLPVAVAEIIPFAVVLFVAAVVVPETTIVLAAQGFTTGGGGVGVVVFLQPIKIEIEVTIIRIVEIIFML